MAVEADLASKHDDDLVKQLRVAQEDLKAQKDKSQKAQADAAADQNQINSSLADVKAANAKQQQLLDQVNGEIGQLVAQEAAQREAAAQAAAQAKFAPSTTGKTGNRSGSSVADDPGPGSGGAGQAIAYARAQLGKPYCYGGAGPDCFDCSGLTMEA